jgi:hypothetical protein
MSHKFRISLRLLLCGAWLSCAMTLSAQERGGDTTFLDTLETGLEGATPIKGEYIAPDKAITYNSAAPTESQWQHTISDKAYSYKDKREYTPRNEPPPEDPFLFKLLVKILQFFSSPTGKFLLWTTLILILGYVAYRIIKGQGKSLFGARDRRPEEDGEEAVLSEESLLEIDWESRMQEALHAGDARTAIRFGYLQLLQLLQRRGYISYRPDKTNMDYYRELVDKPQRQPFRIITRQYEWAWYGAYEPEKAALDAYLQTFNQLKQSLGAV